MSEQSEPRAREFWIDTIDGQSYSSEPPRDKDDWPIIHVIEYSEVERLRAEVAHFKSLACSEHIRINAEKNWTGLIEAGDAMAETIKYYYPGENCKSPEIEKALVAWAKTKEGK